MKKIVYFDSDYVNKCEDSIYDYTNEDIKLKLANNEEGVLLYETLEQFVNDFNNEAISDLGILKLVEIRTDLQIFKEGEGKISEKEMEIIKQYCFLPVIREDKANGYTAFSLGERDTAITEFILREGDEIVNKLNEIDDHWFVGNQFEEYVFVD